MFEFDPILEHDILKAESTRRVERKRLIREALKGQRGRVAFYAPLLAGVGKRLMNWGKALESRYTPLPELPLSTRKHTI